MLPVLLWGLLFWIILDPKARAMTPPFTDPFQPDRDPGDETPERELGCPKCSARNAARAKQGLGPLPGYIFRRRNRDGAIWCQRCDQSFSSAPLEIA
jgi:hypothetical protein